MGQQVGKRGLGIEWPSRVELHLEHGLAVLVAVSSAVVRDVALTRRDGEAREGDGRVPHLRM